MYKPACRSIIQALILLLYMQVSSNGLISFGSSFTNYIPQTFPISVNVVAPYWDDTDTRIKGVVRFDIITPSHPTLSCLLELTSNLIEEENLDLEFNASWLLVARWIDVCPYRDDNCAEVNIQYN